ncbi:MAG TPA: cytochrome P450 [Propionibacteriaceae bacterium]|nr:cytochrome P450 [Propionibacteriaceae bacterium]
MTTGYAARKLEPDGARPGPDLERVVDEFRPRWVVRSFPVARQILRASDATEQAGFGAGMNRSKMRPPILYQEGSQHRAQRHASARFFAPAVIEGYQPMIAELSEVLLNRLRPDKATDLSRLSMRLAVQVTGRVVGLTNSSVRGMSARLSAFFAGDPLASDRSPAGLLHTLRTTSSLLAFYHLDVKPAIRARRRSPSADVISQLLQQGFSDFEILTEALTYAAAGMATTREFITVAAWHLLDEPELRSRYLAAARVDREAILHEILRLEPVVGELRRRTRKPVDVQTAEGPVTIPPGERIELQLRRTNADPDVVGKDPDRLCPDRTLPAAVPPVVLSFGDGHHRCPGGPLAILESDVFLHRLLARDLVADGPPRVRWNPVSQGYDLDRFLVRLRE